MRPTRPTHDSFIVGLNASAATRGRRAADAPADYEPTFIVVRTCDVACHQGRSVRGGAWGGGTGGGAPTGGRLLYKTAFRFNRLEVNVLYEQGRSVR